MAYGDFFREFEYCIEEKGVDFLKSRSASWHSKIARILQSSTIQRQLVNLPLVPLRDGRWACHSETNLFLDAAVPNGIDINLVDGEACKNKDRRKFFHWLGIASCDQATVCKLIIELHSRGRARGIQDLVSDAIYLFQNQEFVHQHSLEKIRLAESPNSLIQDTNSIWIGQAKVLLSASMQPEKGAVWPWSILNISRPPEIWEENSSLLSG